ncbi:integrin alpha-PS2 isoform X2 [Anthonomus grandis grandis]|uniref:integrin alpha-PS2 isoform X2 n=1 Tax=Anthonomus grandis grandis TaxID=2921223 RepID=UPI00216662C8|nr:integrin alpha-PS2 isoform X2 [Anthonomus grandis grandis]
MGYFKAKIILPIVCCVVLLNCFFANGFNIDAFNYAVLGSEDRSMFGFSVAVHKQGYNRPWVLVGAPQAQSQYQPPEVREGGAVYKCRIDGDNPCEEIPFDTKGNHRINGKQMDQKERQWFGATLSTSRSPVGGPIAACAPRYVWFSKEMNRRDPVGTCYVSDANFESFEDYSPCRTNHWGYHRQGSCQAGFSAAINTVGDRLFIGAPGSYYWQGQVYSIDAHARFNYTPGLLGSTYGAKGSVHQQSLENRTAVFQTAEGKQIDDDSYLGYATIVGDFQGTGVEGVAVGMPRGADLHGKVLLFTWELTNYKNISSSQLGSYFGYSLAAADVDGDKKLDLIVGAPMHTEPNTEGKYDVGRVYVFYQGGNYGSFNRSTFLDGFNSKSRFGLSLAYLGDMNQDGYEDFAVGAPYDGEFNRGAVYIFYGSSKGVLEKYGQVIYAEDMHTRSGLPINTFGFSITGGMDMDGNEYPDMAVGAYLSNTAFFFRARPVVRVEAGVRFNIENKQIDIKKKTCTLPNGQKVSCTTIDFCIKYSGKGIPAQIRLKVQYILDTKKLSIPRMSFLRKNGNTLNDTIILYKDSPDTCQTEQINIKNDIRDKLTPLEAEVKYFMIQEEVEDSYYGRVRNPGSQLKPVLDLNLPPSRKDSINIQNDCGHDNVCIPDLHINITKNVQKYLLDSNTNLEFDIIVSNFGEDSFETTLDMTYPEGVYYKKTEVKEDMQAIGILCSTGENRTISCDIGNPLPARKIASFRMIFVPYHKQGIAPTYEFDFIVNSTNPERNETIEDNHSHITVDIWVDSALYVDGRSIPQEVHISNLTQYSSENITKEVEIGPQVTHLYTLRNRGPATIYEAEMYFLWPWQTLAGDDLLYLLDNPHVPEGVKCEMSVPANYRGYQVDYNPKPIWERLQIDSSSHDVGTRYGGVKVESGYVPGTIGGSSATIQNTKLDEEVKISSGDSSTVYEERHNASATSSAQGSGWATNYGQDSSGHIGKAGQQVYTKSEWHKSIVNGKEVIRWTNVTTIKDASGKIINTIYSTDDNNGDQVLSSSNVDNQGSASTTGEENLSISGRFGTATVQTEDKVHQKTNVGTQESSGAVQHFSSGQSGYAQENKFHEEHSYTVGGGIREGGVSSTKSHEEKVISSSTASSVDVEETRRRYEQRLQYEERIRQQELIKSREEERRKKEEEERRRYEAEWRQREAARIAEEIARKQAAERQRKEEELRRQQQTRPTEYEYRRQQQLREEEIRRREQEQRKQQEEERTRIEAERRRQYEYEERIRLDEERRRQWSQQIGESAGSGGQHAGDSFIQGRKRTGYFDAQGVYHDETQLASHKGQDGQIIFNKTWTAESEATIPLDTFEREGNFGGQLSFGQAAASGNGFKTETIDLGDALGRGGANGASGHQWGGTREHTQGTHFSGTLEEGITNQDDYNSDYERNWWEDPSAQPADRHFAQRDNVPTDRPDLSRSRGKRQVLELDRNIDDILKCTATKCYIVKCVVGTLKKDEFISIAMRSRLNVRAVRHLSTTQPVKLSSMMVARISKLPYIGKPKDQALHTHEIFTDIPAGEQELPPPVVPLWIILLSAIAGTLILLLVILLLYKCGFFKRKRPSSAPERQPLRTNGYHGD